MAENQLLSIFVLLVELPTNTTNIKINHLYLQILQELHLYSHTLNKCIHFDLQGPLKINEIGERVTYVLNKLLLPTEWN